MTGSPNKYPDERPLPGKYRANSCELAEQYAFRTKSAMQIARKWIRQASQAVAHMRAAATPRASMPMIVVPNRLGAQAQWARIDAVLATSHEQARRIRERQRAAAAQLDAATYALQLLRDEMAPAFLPVDVRAAAPIIAMAAAKPLGREPFRRREPRAA